MEYLVFIGFTVNMMGTILYVKDTLQSKTKPNRVSWILWGLSPMIGTFAILSNGFTWSALPVFAAGFGPILVLCATFYNKYSYWKITKFDIICAIPSVLALLLWALTKDPFYAILFAIVGDGLATVPTLRKIWNHPLTESVIKFETATFSALTAFFAINEFNFYTLAFPIYLVLANLALIFTYYLRKNYA